MAYNLQEVMVNKPSRLTSGHRMCAGCGAPGVARMILRALKPEDHAVIANATGCMEVSTFIYPYTAWTDSFIHTAFECAGATLSGAEAAYQSMKKQGKLPQDVDTKFIAFGGDGGTYDIGLQSLSGAMERGHDMVYVCYDNGAYMNTGIQRSSATPKFADTTTSPAGSVIPGKMQNRKDLTKIIAEHHIPYVAQTLAMTNFKDLYEKAEKAIYTDRASIPKRNGTMSKRMGLQHRRPNANKQTSRRHLLLATIRSNRWQIPHNIQASQQTTNRRISKTTKKIQTHVQTRQRMDDPRIPTRSRPSLARTPRPRTNNKQRITGSKNTRK